MKNNMQVASQGRTFIPIKSAARIVGMDHMRFRTVLRSLIRKGLLENDVIRDAPGMGRYGRTVLVDRAMIDSVKEMDGMIFRKRQRRAPKAVAVTVPAKQSTTSFDTEAPDLLSAVVIKLLQNGHKAAARCVLEGAE